VSLGAQSTEQPQERRKESGGDGDDPGEDGEQHSSDFNQRFETGDTVLVVLDRRGY